MYRVKRVRLKSKLRKDKRAYEEALLYASRSREPEYLAELEAVLARIDAELEEL